VNLFYVLKGISLVFITFCVNDERAYISCRLQQYKVVEMKLLAQQRELQVSLPSISVYYNTLSSTIQKPDPA
jgi:hypothetical protein